MSDPVDMQALRAGATEDLVGGRLRDGRRDRDDGLRGAGRSARCRSRRARARRCLRQRQRARSPRRGAHGVAWSAVDFVPALLERGRERAAAERLDVEFVEGDAAELPFADGEFDVVILDLRRDVRPRPEAGGRRAAARLQARRSDRHGQLGPRRPGQPALRDRSPNTRRRRPGFTPPVLWGTEEHVRELFGDGVSELRFERRISRQPFRSIDHYLEIFRTYFGPIKLAFDRVGADGRSGAGGRPARATREVQHGGRPRLRARARVPAGDRDAAPSAG